MNFKDAQTLFQKLKYDQNQILKAEKPIDQNHHLKDNDLKEIVNFHLESVCEKTQKRILDELDGFGPIASLIDDNQVSEILINQYDQIYFEKNGLLEKSEDHFFERNSYKKLIEKICFISQTYINTEKPFIEIQYHHLRITVIFPDLARGEYLVSIRKQPNQHWTLQRFFEQNWASNTEIDKLKNILQKKKNFLIVGGTGSGKTSLLQAMIHEIPKDRLILIEDTQELQPVYDQNVSLLTRYDPTQKLMNVTMNDLIKRALRLRPDRLCVGEIRGDEATALLMALATGHDGSFGSLHARTAHEALIRLEMLIQMGAPQWSLNSVRRLIGLTLQNIIVVEKINGQRRLQGIYEIASVEETGITLSLT